VVAAGVAVAVFALRRGEPRTAPVVASPVEQAPGTRKSFTLFIDSTPSGAAVVEGEGELGNTPIQISVDNDAARREPRKLSIRRDGFQPYSILQGPSDDNVRIIATLVALPAEPLNSAAAKGHTPQPTAQHAPKPAKTAVTSPETTHEPAPPAPAPAPQPSPGDIRLQR
jgi:serine/threonine-protein kinase